MNLKVTAAFFAFACMAFGQTHLGSRVFIAPMEGNLDGFIAAEIIKQHVPMQVVTDEKDADFVLVGLSLKENNLWYNVIFDRFKDRNEGNVRLLDVKNKTMVWAGEAGDRSLFFAEWRRGGERKIAQRIADRMKKEYCEGQRFVATGDRVTAFLLNKDGLGF